MTTIMYTTLIIAFLAAIFYKQIHKYNIYLYMLAVLVVLLTTTKTPNLINRGFIPTAFFMVVLFSGLLDRGDLRKHLFMVRAELAIIGSILIFPHVYGYLEYYLQYKSIYNMSASFYFGLLAYLVMLPLFITSFQFVRRKMGYKTWKKLHKLAYVFFFLVAIHVILLSNVNLTSYVAIFGFYFTFKIVAKMYDSSAKPQRKGSFKRA